MQFRHCYVAKSMTQASPPRIFLSYARTDGAMAATKLRDGLANAALTAGQPLAVWQDLTSMRSGQWREQIRAAIRTGDHLLMVLSAEALQSEVCAWEWHVARLAGAEISPVLADPAYDLANLPKWMKAQHIYRLDLAASGIAEHPEWQRLVASLRAAPASRRMPTISRTPGERFVPRPTEMHALRAMLLDARGDAVGITTAFTGSGGMGKTTLALALAHDQRIQSAFYGGQLLVELGQQPNLLLVLRAALLDLTGENSDAETLKQATEKLASALADRRILLVIDDVWNWLHLEPFMQGGPGCARLVTTRDEGVLAKFRSATKPITVDQMSEDQAVALLAAGLSAADIAAHSAFLVSLANRLGRCALLLELANGRIWTWEHDRGGLSGAVDEAEIEFHFKGVTAFDTEDRAPVDLSNPTTRNEAYADSIAASLDTLNAEHTSRFLELAIFPEDTDVPYTSIVLYWAETAGMDERATFNLLDRLKRMSLVKGALVKDVDPTSKAETPRPAVRLHDVIRSYTRDPARTKSDALADLNRRFWKAHVDAGERAFAEGTALAKYAFERLPWHLHEAGERKALDALLLDPGWLRAKLEVTRSPQNLVADYEQFGNGQMQSLIGRTLRLTTRILARDPRQLGAQLAGRLMANTAPEAAAFVASARSIVRPAIVPYRPSLTPPGAELARLEGRKRDAVRALAVLADGRLVIGSDDTIRVWNPATGEELSWPWGTDAIAVLKDGQHIASGGSRPWLPDGGLRLWDPESDAILVRLDGHQNSVAALAVLADGRIASGSFDNSIRIWGAKNGKELSRLDGHLNTVHALVVLPDGRLVSGSSDHSIRFWDPDSGAELARLHGHDDSIHALAALPGGRLASGSGNHESGDCTIRLWDVASGVELLKLEGHDSRVTALAVLPDGRLVSGSDDQTISIWDPDSGTELARLDGHENTVTALAVLADGRIVSGSTDDTVRLWDSARDGSRPLPDGHRRKITALAALPDGRVASGSEDNTILVWDPVSGGEIARLSGHEREVTALAVLADGRLASASDDNTIRLWNPASGQQLGRLEAHRYGILPMAALPDGRLASGSAMTIHLWDTSRGAVNANPNCLSVLTDGARPNRLRALIALADGRLIAGTEDATIHLLNPTTGAELARLDGHQRDVNALALLPNGWLASASWDETIRLWDLATGKELKQLVGHQGSVNALALLPNGRLVSASNDKTIRLWDAANGAELARLEVDASVCALLALRDGHLVAGDSLGRLHWLEVLQ